MKLRVTTRAVAVGVLAAALSLSALGQRLPSSVTPEMVEQLKSLSSSQQQALAKQYGISLPAADVSSLTYLG